MQGLLIVLVLLWAVPAWAVTCGPVPSSFPLTQTAVSTNFAKLYDCINGGVSPSNNPVFTGTATFDGTATFNAGLTLGLHLPDGWGEAIVLRESHGNSIVLQAHDGALYISNGGTDGPGFGGANLAITVFGKRGRTQEKIEVGKENSGGIGYRMLRVVN
jgi:hypothetical protein